jgi:hypothetical protein
MREGAGPMGPASSHYGPRGGATGVRTFRPRAGVARAHPAAERRPRPIAESERRVGGLSHRAVALLRRVAATKEAR